VCLATPGVDPTTGAALPLSSLTDADFAYMPHIPLLVLNAPPSSPPPPPMSFAVTPGSVYAGAPTTVTVEVNGTGAAPLAGDYVRFVLPSDQGCAGAATNDPPTCQAASPDCSVALSADLTLVVNMPDAEQYAVCLATPGVDPTTGAALPLSSLTDADFAYMPHIPLYVTSFVVTPGSVVANVQTTVTMEVNVTGGGVKAGPYPGNFVRFVLPSAQECAGAATNDLPNCTVGSPDCSVALSADLTLDVSMPAAEYFVLCLATPSLDAATGSAGRLLSDQVPLSSLTDADFVYMPHIPLLVVHAPPSSPESGSNDTVVVAPADVADVTQGIAAAAAASDTTYLFWLLLLLLLLLLLCCLILLLWCCLRRRKQPEVVEAAPAPAEVVEVEGGEGDEYAIDAVGASLEEVVPEGTYTDVTPVVFAPEPEPEPEPEPMPIYVEPEPLPPPVYIEPELTFVDKANNFFADFGNTLSFTGLAAGASTGSVTAVVTSIEADNGVALEEAEPATGGAAVPNGHSPSSTQRLAYSGADTAITATSGSGAAAGGYAISGSGAAAGGYSSYSASNTTGGDGTTYSSYSSSSSTRGGGATCTSTTYSSYSYSTTS